jgi:hypothetical protein
MTAHHWRTLRLKLLLAGVSDPMALASMHALLDSTEGAILEAISAESAKDSEMKRSLFLDKLYAPHADPYAINDDGYVPKPKGFEDDEVEASFAAFAAAAH